MSPSLFSDSINKTLGRAPLTLKDILVNNSVRRVKGQRVIEMLVEDGQIKRQCQRCSCDKWEGEPIPLELHHENGDPLDNRFENLQVLCPNCHALTPNYCGKANAGQPLGWRKLEGEGLPNVLHEKLAASRQVVGRRASQRTRLRSEFLDQDALFDAIEVKVQKNREAERDYLKREKERHAAMLQQIHEGKSWKS